MDEKTIQTYNQMAKEYDDETIDFWQKFPRTFFDKFAALVKGKVLDVGSGPGRDGLLLQERGLEVICLDASEAMVNLCKEKGLQSVVGDFISMPFEDNSFNGAWAYTSLLHVSKADISRALNEIRRVLKDGGIFGLGMIEGDTEEYRESAGVNMPRWFSFYRKEELEKLLENHGFRVLYFEELKPRAKNYLHFITQKQ
ncbi:MAG: class I SAM-dependent methyltransferase [Candidatus Wildermuthbacteria bacterium]|nr:class I SAM-dependent methyltransferase [Candidatus Wildermuthbacteria bacterium]